MHSAAAAVAVAAAATATSGKRCVPVWLLMLCWDSVWLCVLLLVACKHTTALVLLACLHLNAPAPFQPLYQPHNPQLDQPAAAAAADEAQQQYASWLSRQYAAYVSAVLQLCTASSSASLQVAAVSALMECVRHEAGPAAFSNRLFSRLLTALVLSPNTQPEVRPCGGGEERERGTRSAVLV